MAAKASKKRLGRGLNSLLSATRFQELAEDEVQVDSRPGAEEVALDSRGERSIGMGGPNLSSIDYSIEQDLARQRGSAGGMIIEEEPVKENEDIAYHNIGINVSTVGRSREEGKVDTTKRNLAQEDGASGTSTESRKARGQDGRDTEVKGDRHIDRLQQQEFETNDGGGTQQIKGDGEVEHKGAFRMHGAVWEESLRSGKSVKSKTAIEMGEIPLDALRKNPHQPRTHWDEHQLERLAQSIRANGLIQPVVVRRQGEGYELIAGERRLRAARMAGLEKIPAIIRVATEEEMLEWSLVENIHRADLNPMERARAYQRYLRSFSLTQYEAAERLGEDRATLSNYIRLLELSEKVQDLTARGVLSMGHARAMLALEGASLQDYFAEMAEDYGWSVRELENRIRLYVKKNMPSGPEYQRKEKAGHVMELEKQLSEAMALRVWIKAKGVKGNRGTVTIEFNSFDDFEKIQEALTGKGRF